MPNRLAPIRSSEVLIKLRPATFAFVDVAAFIRPDISDHRWNFPLRPRDRWHSVSPVNSLSLAPPSIGSRPSTG